MYKNLVLYVTIIGLLSNATNFLEMARCSCFCSCLYLSPIPHPQCSQSDLKITKQNPYFDHPIA